MTAKTLIRSPQKLRREIEQAAAAVHTQVRDFTDLLNQAKQGATDVEATLEHIHRRQTSGDNDPQLHQRRNEALNNLASFRDLQRRCQAHLLTVEQLASSYQTMTAQAVAAAAGCE